MPQTSLDTSRVPQSLLLAGYRVASPRKVCSMQQGARISTLGAMKET